MSARVPEINTVCLAGRVVFDPDCKQTSSGLSVLKLRMVANRKRGEKLDELFISVGAFGKTAEFCARTVKKGMPIIVTGRLIQNEWEGKDGQKRTTIEIIADNIEVLEWPGDGQGRTVKAATPSVSEIPDNAVTEDDLPF